MDDCCAIPAISKEDTLFCPECQHRGKAVGIITLKALLLPSALEIMDPNASYRFCDTKSCNVVYFSDHQKFHKREVKVPVFQKDNRANVPVCYCFGWTRKRIEQAVEQGDEPTIRIKKQVQANRCGCEVNNPQGSCCLGNVTTVLRGHEESTV